MKHILAFLFATVLASILYYGTTSLNKNVQLSSFRNITAQLLSEDYVKENILSQNGEFKENESEYIFNNKTFPAPANYLKSLSNKPDLLQTVLGSTTESKKIIVDLAAQRVYAYEGDRLAFNFLVSTGKWDATPPGNYKIWYKVRSQTMKGGSKELGTYYYLPNVQWIQYFNNGIGFHSTYWHNNFGTPMSHGCVNMTIIDAETLYHWASPTMTENRKIFRSTSENPGTPVEVVNSWDF